MKNPQKCEACHKKFNPNPRSKNQRYCDAVPCQKTRKRRWQRKKMQSDPDYRENQQRATKEWRSNNKGYSRSYRASNPEYVQRNRSAQKQRNARHRIIAKMDALGCEYELKPGLYRIIGPSRYGVAKMDALPCEIFIIPGIYSRKNTIAKKDTIDQSHQFP